MDGAFRFNLRADLLSPQQIAQLPDIYRQAIEEHQAMIDARLRGLMREAIARRVAPDIADLIEADLLELFRSIAIGEYPPTIEGP